MPAAELKERWAKGEVTYGATLRLGNLFLAEAVALSGFDFIKIDMEHGMNWQSTLMPMVQVINGTGVTVLVKVPTLDREFIGWVLDLGAEGITCPGISTPEEAEYAVSCTRFVPRGIRGSTSFYTKYLPGGKTRDTICIATIESVTGSQNAGAIASVDGIDGVTVGPGDLGQDLGLEHVDTGHDGPRPGPHEDAIKAIFAACRENGIAYGMTDQGGGKSLIEKYGCQIISLGGEIGFFEAGMKAALAKR